jgi:hypothetical protein
MKNLAYYIAEIKRQNPGISDKDATTFAKKIYKMDPASDFAGKRPKLDDTYKLFKANEKAKTITSTATASPSPAPSTSTTKSPSDVKENTTGFAPIASGIQEDFTQFGKSLVYNAGGTGQASLTPYVSGKETDVQGNPKPIVILPTTDGQFYIVGDLDNYVRESISRLPSGDIAKYKLKLKEYYPTTAAFERSYQGGPVTDQDLEFANAVKKALQEITVNNFFAGKLIADKIEQDPDFKQKANSFGFYSFDRWIESRQLTPEPTSSRESTSGITSEVDALAEFRRTVQQYVGDFDLVNEYDALAKAYVELLNAEELKRKSTGISTTDPLGNNRFSESYTVTQLSEVDRLEMRLKLITQGAKGTKGKAKGKIISTGIRDANAEDLQDAGGSIGDNYTKLKSYAFDYGVRIDDSQLKLKAAESLLPGGSIEEQRRTIQLASRAFYKPLAPYIEAGLKVSDIADQFRKIKRDELELADGSVDIFDKDVQAAISGDKLWRPDEMIMASRLDPKWRTTKKANEGAAGLVDAVLKLWGQVG